jgi:hypothetical protein
MREDTEEAITITEGMIDDHDHVIVITIRKRRARVRVGVEVMTKKKDTERKVVNIESTYYSKKELND